MSDNVEARVATLLDEKRDDHYQVPGTRYSSRYYLKDYRAYSVQEYPHLFSFLNGHVPQQYILCFIHRPACISLFAVVGIMTLLLAPKAYYNTSSLS